MSPWLSPDLSPARPGTRAWRWGRRCPASRVSPAHSWTPRTPQFRPLSPGSPLCCAASILRPPGPCPRLEAPSLSLTRGTASGLAWAASSDPPPVLGGHGTLEGGLRCDSENDNPGPMFIFIQIPLQSECGNGGIIYWSPSPGRSWSLGVEAGLLTVVLWRSLALLGLRGRHRAPRPHGAARGCFSCRCLFLTRVSAVAWSVSVNISAHHHILP